MRIGLQTRLFVSHFVVMIVGLSSFIAINKLAAHHSFRGHLARITLLDSAIEEIEADLLEGFETTWSRSIAWALLPGAFTAAGLSYWVARRITLSLSTLERSARSFAAGNLSVRVPPSDIPELAQLSASFNRMALSLQHVEEHRRQLIGELTHELRTPLTIVRSYLEEVAEDQRVLSPETACLLVREALRLERLVDHLQEFSKLEAGQLPLNLQSISLPPVFEKLLQRFEVQVTEDGPQLQRICAETIAPVLADPDRLDQILVNLVGNALQHTPQGQIILKAWETDSAVWIEVEDTGLGISPEDLSHIFERFWRSSRSIEQNPQGMGIGLALTQRLVALHGGILEVESKVEKGSRFRFNLPKA